MARKIVIEFLGDSKDLQRAMGDAESKSGRLGGVLGKIGGIAAVGFGAIVAGAGAVAVSGVKLEQQYSKTMSLVGAATGAAGETMKELDALAMKMGAETAFSANEAADAMLELAKAGVTTKDIMGGGLKNTLLLATAGGTDLATAATIASNAMNTFSLKGTQMNKVAAALAGGANASSASVESLGQGLQQVGPGAVNAGLSLQETVAALSAFDAAGIKGSDAGTSLKTMLARLIPPTKSAALAMESVGLWTEATGSAFVNADGSFKSLTEVSGLLQEKLGGLSEAQRSQALTQIFGSDASRAAAVLMKEGAAGVSEFIKATKDQEAAQRMADAAMSGSAGAMERLRGSVETLQLQIGKALAPVLTEVANWLASTGVPAFSGFATTLGEVVPAAFEKLKAVVSTVMGGMSGDVGSGLGQIQAIFSDVTSIISSLWGRFGGTLTDFTRKSFDNVKQIIGGALTVVQGIFQTFAALLQGNWSGAWEGVKKILSGATEVIKGVVRQAMNAVGTLIELGWSAAKGVTSAMWDGIKTVVSNAISSLVGWIADIPGRLREKVGSFRDAGAALIGGVVDGMKNAAGVIEGIASNVWNAVRSLLNSAIDKINAALEFTISLPGPDITVNPPNIRHLARGTSNWRGGLAVVGEEGPELVNLPRGSRVTPHGESMGALRGMAAAGPTIVQLVIGARVVEQLLIEYTRDTGQPLQVRTLGPA